MSLCNNYTQKCEMNVEVDHLLRFFYFRELDELFILTGSSTDKKDDADEEGEEWQGFIQKVREFQQEETEDIKKYLKEEVLKEIKEFIETK